jgi:hypothetical protein
LKKLFRLNDRAFSGNGFSTFDFSSSSTGAT